MAKLDKIDRVGIGKFGWCVRIRTLLTLSSSLKKLSSGMPWTHSRYWLSSCRLQGEWAFCCWWSRWYGERIRWSVFFCKCANCVNNSTKLNK